MKILLFGAQGQVGSEVMQLATHYNYSISGWSHQQLDITDDTQINAVLNDSQAEVVINAAAYTAVDKAEQEPQLAFKVNRDGPILLAKACHKAKIPLLHLSTDYVFNGDNHRPYLETDPVAPLNVYGQSKWEGEVGIRDYCSAHIILRTSSVFGAQGQNFVKTILRLAKEKEELQIVNDQINCPTPAAEIAVTLLEICRQLQPKNYPWGTFHYCSDEATSWFDFATTLVELAAPLVSLKLKKIIPVSSKDYKTLATRPLYSVLNCTKLITCFDLKLPSWRQALLKSFNLAGQ